MSLGGGDGGGGGGGAGGGARGGVTQVLNGYQLTNGQLERRQ